MPTTPSDTPALPSDADLARHELAELTRLRAATWESQRASGKTGTAEFLKLLLAIHQQILLLAGFQLESESSRRSRLASEFRAGQGEHAAPPHATFPQQSPPPNVPASHTITESPNPTTTAKGASKK